jgi:hypothetical protein
LVDINLEERNTFEFHGHIVEFRLDMLARTAPSGGKINNNQTIRVFFQSNMGFEFIHVRKIHLLNRGHDVCEKKERVGRCRADNQDCCFFVLNRTVVISRGTCT